MAGYLKVDQPGVLMGLTSSEGEGWYETGDIVEVDEEGFVRVVIAHCASSGQDADLDHRGKTVTCFELFARLMDAPAYRERLFGDISAITQRNRPLAVLRTLVEREDWHDRLLYGSDYPLPGVMPLFAPAMRARAGLLDDALVPLLNRLQGINPLLFDFVLKRHLGHDGRRLPTSVFATRPFLDRKPT